VSRATEGRTPRAAVLAGWLVRLYPSAWRARYADEQLAWVIEGGLGPRVALDLARGALDAHLHCDLAGERGIPMPDRLRGLLVGVLCGYAAFVFAGAGYQKLTEYDDFVAAAHHHAGVGAAFDAVLAASLVALVAMLAAGVPIGLAAVRQVLAGHRELLGPLVVVAVGMVWLVGTVGLLAWHARGSALPAGQMGSAAGFYGWIASLVLAAAVGVAGAAVAVRRTALAAGILRVAAGAAVVTSAAMVVMLAATVVWGVALRAADPALFHSAQGIRASSTAGTWAAIVALMAAATAIAGVACARGLRAVRRDPEEGVAA
jgi:hypothetical protein